MTEDILKNLKSYQPEQYSSGITNAKLAAVALFKLEENNIEKTFENVVMALQKLFPGKFSLILYPDIPDTIRVDNTLRLDAGKKHAEYILGNRPRGYTLTLVGRVAAEEAIIQLESIQKSNRKQIVSKNRNRFTTLVYAVQSTEAYQKFVKKQFSLIDKFDCRLALQCTLDTAEAKVRANLNGLSEAASFLKSIKEYAEPANDVLKFLKYLEDNWEVLLK